MNGAPGGERCSGRGGEDEPVGLAAWTARRVGRTGRVGQGIGVKTLTTDLDIFRSAKFLIKEAAYGTIKTQPRERMTCG